jgi:integrase
MTVYDRWHKSRPAPDEPRCGQHKMVPSADHGKGERWQVRWRDENGRQCKRNFAKKEGKDPELHADAFHAKVHAELDAGTYVDPAAGAVTLRDYSEEWRKGRVHDLATAIRIEAAFRNHVYAADGTPHKTPGGAPAIGDYPLRTLARRITLVQAWISGISTGPNTARKIIDDVSQVFVAALDDGIIPRNPLKAKSVQKPKAEQTEAIPWTADEVEAVADRLPGEIAAMPYLGASCGMRQGELFAAGLDDLDFLRKTMHVEVQVKLVGGCMYFAPVKNGKVRDVPVADPVIPVLSEHVRMHPPVRVTLPWMQRGSKLDGKLVTRDLLFAMNGSAIHRNSFNRVWRKAWSAAGVPDRGRLNGCHVLRHTAASAWLSEGLSLAKVAAFLGDTQEVVLKTYSHFMPDDDDRAREIMNAFFTPKQDDAGQDSSALIVPGGTQ